MVSQRAVSKWIAASGTKTQRDELLPWRKWQPELWQQDAGYLLRLDLVSHGLLGRGLYEEEARWATRLELALQSVSVFAQWAVVEEYARRHINSETPTTDDLDLMLATRPWRDEGLLERTARQAGVGSTPTIRTLVLPHTMAWPLLKHISLFKPDILTALAPRVAKRLFEHIDRAFVVLRVVLHISHELQQPVIIQPRSNTTEHYPPSDEIGIGTKCSDDADPNETQFEKSLSEEALLLQDLFQALDRDRRQSIDE